ncbi:uncharacterized protein LOC114265750 isoform X2 [Camellia sinensis]|uniref:uncharacterized protein LOC114265750 isoform X2 n=1 Tax=Camellia sinensis TaxID=4442 RepID=UPI00103666FF|nr:uncharacterized protein LOC114265750 isoform X2 [Camellia sinensis]
MSPYKPYFVSPNLYFKNPPPSSSNLSLTQISHSLALSRFFFRAIAISKFRRANQSTFVWLQSRSFLERLQFRFQSSILSTAIYNLRKTNQILQNLLQLRDLSQNGITAISILISKLSLSLDFKDQGIAYAEIKALRESRKHYAKAGLKTCLVIQSQDPTADYLLNCKVGTSPITCNNNLSVVRLETTKMLIEPLNRLKQADAHLNMTQGVLEGVV